MTVTIDGGWVVFGALAAGWVALMVAHRFRTTNDQLKAAQTELDGARARLADLENGHPPLVAEGELGQLASALESASQGDLKQMPNQP